MLRTKVMQINKQIGMKDIDYAAHKFSLLQPE